MRKLIILSLIAISVILILSCNNHAYKVVATTVNPTAKQKALLSIACTNQFGKNEPIFTEGKTKTDTLILHSTDTFYQVRNDTVIMTVFKTDKQIVNHYRTDTIRQPDKAREYFLQSQLRDKENIISNLENDNKQKDEKVKDIRHKLVIAFIGYGIELLALILFVYFKLKGKIIGLS